MNIGLTRILNMLILIGIIKVLFCVPFETKKVEDISYELSTNIGMEFFIPEDVYYGSDDSSQIRINLLNENDLPPWLEFENFHKDDFVHTLGRPRSRGFAFIDPDVVLIARYGQGLVSYNFSDPTKLSFISMFDITIHDSSSRSVFERVFLSPCKKYAYVCETGSEVNTHVGRILSIDVSDPERMFLVDQYDSGLYMGYLGSLYCLETTCYAGVEYRLDIVSMSDPSKLTQISNTSLPLCPEAFRVEVDLDAELVFVSCKQDGIYVVSISDPYHPEVLSVFTDHQINSAFLAHRARDSVLFVSQYNPERNITIVNYTNPYNLTTIRNWDPPEAAPVFELFLHPHRDDYIFLMMGNSKGIQGLNISDLNDITRTDKQAVGGWAVNGYVHDNLLFVGVGGYPTFIVDVSDLYDFVEVSRMSDVGTTRRFSVDDDLQMSVIPYERGGAYLIDTSDYKNPTTVMHFMGSTTENQEVYDAKIRGEYIYILHEKNGLTIYETFSTMEQHISRTDVAGINFRCFEVNQDQTLAYITSSSNQFVIMNITDKSSPTVLSNVPSRDKNWEVVVKDYLVDDSILTYAFLITEDYLRIWNVTDPYNPTVASDLYFPTGNQQYVRIEKNRDILYASAQGPGFHIVNVSNKTHPEHIDTFDTNSGRGMSVDEENMVLWLADYSQAVERYNISDPSNIQLLPDIFRPGTDSNSKQVMDVHYIRDDPRKRIQYVLYEYGFFIQNTIESAMFTVVNLPEDDHEIPCTTIPISLEVTDGSGRIHSNFSVVVHRKGFLDSRCNVTTCNGVMSNDTASVCTNHGVCESFIDDLTHEGYGLCDCVEGAWGERCDVYRCFDYYSNESMVCSGRNGRCNFDGTCSCYENYYGVECEVTKCDHVFSNSSNEEEICFGHGYCWPYEHCNCDPHYYGSSCNVTTCYGVFSNVTDTEALCYGHGKCYEHDECFCHIDQYYGPFCNITTCYGIWNNDTVNLLHIKNHTSVPNLADEYLCSGHGSCYQYDKCICDVYEDGRYMGEYCNVTSCDGVLSNESAVCSGHGDCMFHENCTCDDDYFGEDCDLWRCYSFLRTDTEFVCSGHGDCASPDKCVCSEVEYKGTECAEWLCFNVSVIDLNNVCNGKGVCVDNDVCLCHMGYSSSATNSPCDQFYCGEYFYTDPRSCHERGECIASHRCSCFDNFEGDLCQSWSCGFSFDNPFTCSGHGMCTSPDVCECSFGYSGKLCETNTMYATIMAPILSVAGVFAVIIVLVVIVLIIFCCIFLICVFICVLCMLGGATLNLRFRVKKFKKLKNFDILLKEQELEEDESVAHIRIDRSLFEIPMDEIRLERILGEGGSNSTVYLASWNGRDVGFKCFKTRTVCSSQDAFDEFERELSILGSVNHPNVIQCYGCSLKPPRVGIVMEYCSKGDLDVFLKVYYSENGKSYPLQEKLRVAMEICAACHYLHSRNIIHRDLKLGNVLLDDSETVKLMDFGLSRTVDRISIAKTKNVGTSIYMAPEIVFSTKYDEKVDVFSFGMMLYIIITENYSPFGREESLSGNLEMRIASNNNFRPDLSVLRKKVSEEMVNLQSPMSSQIIKKGGGSVKWLERTISSCWTFDPKQRPSMKQLAELFRLRLASLTVMTENKEQDDGDQKNMMNLKEELAFDEDIFGDGKYEEQDGEEDVEDCDLETLKRKYFMLKQGKRMERLEMRQVLDEKNKRIQELEKMLESLQ